MRRPSPAGLLIVLAFAVPIVIEIRTVLTWIGIDVPIGVYVPAALALLAATVALIWVLGEEEGNPTSV